jgi:hypothetical protein
MALANPNYQQTQKEAVGWSRGNVGVSKSRHASICLASISLEASYLFGTWVSRQGQHSPDLFFF